MAILAKDEGKDFERATPGMHDAICVFVVDVGTHIQKTQWGDKKQHQIVICWEIDEKLKEGDFAGKPFMVSRRYTFTLFKKANLSKHLESWLAKSFSDETRKKGFDVEKLIGRKCTLNLIESADGKYLNIDGVLPANSANNLIQACKEQPKWIQKLIDTSLELQGGVETNDSETPPPPNDDAWLAGL